MYDIFMAPDTSPRFSLTHNDRQLVNFTETELHAAGVPAEAIDAAKAAARREAIKAECRRRIYAIASAETQMNMTAAAAMISAKTASSRTDAEKSVLAGQEAALAWVAAMRDNVAVLADDTDADHLADASWPACPPAVLALVAQF